MAQDETGSRTPAAASGERAARKQRIVAALSRGNFDQLDADVEWLLRQSPRDFDALKFAAVVALQRHDLSRAYGYFESARAAAADPVSRALAYAGLCEVLMAGGDALGAEPHAREALRLDAGNPEYHKLLARCHMGQGRVQEAITSMQRSIEALPPAFGDGLKLHLAGLMMQAGRAGDALAIVEALGSPVAGSIDALMTKATLLQVSGRFEAAAGCYRRALQAVPGLPYNYAFMECLGPRAAEERDRLRDRLAQVPAADTRARIDLNFALARATDAAGETDAAFQHLQEGNRLKRATLHYSLSDDAGVFEDVRRVFDRDAMERLAAPAVAGELTPIFIVGMPRSGTTLVEQILGAHPQVAAAGELPFIAMLAREFMQRVAAGRASAGSPPGKLAADLSAMAGRYLALLRERSQGRAYATDKMPLNFRYLGFIRLLFPEAPIVHCQRDAMDSCFSCYQQLFEGSNLPFCYDLQELGGFHRLYRGYLAHWQETLRSAPFELRYEGLVADAESETRRLLAYCGLGFDPACLEFHAAQRTVLTASAGQVRSRLYTTAVGKWRRYERHLGGLAEALADPA